MPTESTMQITPERLMQFTFGFAPPLIIEAAIRHRIFDALDEGTKTIEEVCTQTRTSARGLRAILNALVGLELLAKDDEGRYGLTPESATYLVTGKPIFHGAFFLLTSEPMLSQWRKLYEIVRSGLPAQHINREQDGAAFFLRFGRGIMRVESRGAVVGTRFGCRVRRVERRSCAAIAACSRHRGGLGWRVPITRRVAARFGVADRFRFVEGDLLEADFGGGHAIATAGHILHSEGEERSRPHCAGPRTGTSDNFGNKAK